MLQIIQGGFRRGISMETSINRNLRMVRGDTFAFSFEVSGTDLLDTVFFSCKINADDEQYLFQKSLNDGITYRGNGRFSVRVAPNVTKDLEVGSYYYDLEIGVNGDIFTIMKGRFKIEQDITRY